MQIRPSSALRNEYTQISELAKASGEPIFITNKGEDDGVYMSMAAYEEREKMFRHRDKIYAAELSRLSGEPVCTPEELDERMEELFRAYENKLVYLPPAQHDFEEIVSITLRAGTPRRAENLQYDENDHLKRLGHFDY